MFTMDMKISGFDDELNEAMKKEIKTLNIITKLWKKYFKLFLIILVFEFLETVVFFIVKK